MATFELDTDHGHGHIRWIRWVEKDAVIGQIVCEWDGRFRIAPHGPHWSPMKSFAGSFISAQTALCEIQLYFRDR
jgi:hypothetical protein